MKTQSKSVAVIKSYVIDRSVMVEVIVAVVTLRVFRVLAEGDRDGDAAGRQGARGGQLADAVEKRRLVNIRVVLSTWGSRGMGTWEETIIFWYVGRFSLVC